ncbi:MAG TPA: hypothetical protein VHG93_07810 [Longimicrobium sp.]|nr:hypothetical protein [Longimicrobium sp.]
MFPILVDTGTELIVLRRAGEGDRLARLVAPDAKLLDVIDSRVEGFAYDPKHDIISPLTLKKDWRKAEIIALYNDRKPAGAPPYAPNLASRTLVQVFADVVGLVRPTRAGRPRADS